MNRRLRSFEAGAAGTEQRQRASDSPYLLTEEAAELLRFNTPALFYKWAKRNRIPVLRRGRTLLYDRRVLNAFLKLKPKHASKSAPLSLVGER